MISPGRATGPFVGLAGFGELVESRLCGAELLPEPRLGRECLQQCFGVRDRVG